MVSPGKRKSSSRKNALRILSGICTVRFTAKIPAQGRYDDKGKRTVLVFLLYLFLLSTPALAQNQESITRGAYLAKLGDCTACHTQPGHPQFAGGAPAHSPFGTIYTTNITPDPTYGIGQYTLNDFSRALRDGIARDGHRLYPAMPYPSYSKLSDQDIADLYAYFMKGVAPSDYQPPETKLPFPFNQRWGLYFWDVLFAPHHPYLAKVDHDAAWNRGAYIVQGLEHCGACHTPRDLAFKEEGYDETSPRFLTGETLDNWAAVDLRGDKASGLGRWSEADIASFLRYGHGAKAAAFGSMGQVVTDSSQYMTPQDAASVAHYLKSLSPSGEDADYQAGEVAAPNIVNAISEHPGAGLFMSACAGCHQPDGSGRNNGIPALAGNPALMTQDPSSVIRIILEGATTPHVPGGLKPQAMPSFAHLTDREIGEVASYVRNAFGNRAGTVSTRQVETLRKTIIKEKKSDPPGTPD
jgi:mono/diheme cytochrome c family protein